LFSPGRIGQKSGGRQYVGARARLRKPSRWQLYEAFQHDRRCVRTKAARGLPSPGIPDRQVRIRFRKRPYLPGYRSIRTCALWIDDANHATRRITFRAFVGQAAACASIQSGWRGQSSCWTSSRSSQQLCQTPRVHDIESIAGHRNARSMSYFDAGEFGICRKHFARICRGSWLAWRTGRRERSHNASTP
jgi:hypothetical protein